MLPWSPLKGYEMIVSPQCSHISPALHVFDIYIFLPPSGLLTGKFQRGDPPPSPSSSRVGWVEEDKQARTNQSHPNLSSIAGDNSFWKLLDALSEIADAHGERVPVPIYLITSIR